MTEAHIIQQFNESRRNAQSRCETVNALRHLLMDRIAIDVSDDAAYMAVYLEVMRSIESRYPLLSWEVQRQVAKKRRRQERKAHAKQGQVVHL